MQEIKFEPVQTNQRPKMEKIRQRIWSVLNVVCFRLTPWFARRVRVGIVRLAGGGGNLPRVRRLRGRVGWIILGIFRLGRGRALGMARGFMRSTRFALGRIVALARECGFLRGRTILRAHDSIWRRGLLRLGTMCGLRPRPLFCLGCGLGKGRLLRRGRL